MILIVVSGIAGLAAGIGLRRLVVAETGSDEAAPEAPGWTAIDERLYGAARVSFLRRA